MMMSLIGERLTNDRRTSHGSWHLNVAVTRGVSSSCESNGLCESSRDFFNSK